MVECNDEDPSTLHFCLSLPAPRVSLALKPSSLLLPRCSILSSLLCIHLFSHILSSSLFSSPLLSSLKVCGGLGAAEGAGPGSVLRSQQVRGPRPSFILFMLLLFQLASAPHLYAFINASTRCVPCTTDDPPHYPPSISLQVKWVAQASAEQRKGRAGRTGPGHCYRSGTALDRPLHCTMMSTSSYLISSHPILSSPSLRLYSSAFYDQHMVPFQPPEIATTSLEDLLLQVRHCVISAETALSSSCCLRSTCALRVL